MDGVSNPAIIDFDKNPAPGPAPIRAGAIITGRDGDAKKDKRDPWMVDGSFLVFRLLFQRVPEFDEFLNQNPIDMPGMSKAEGSELLGARMVGRWKSGQSYIHRLLKIVLMSVHRCTHRFGSVRR